MSRRRETTRKEKRLDWAKFTDFRSRNSKQDLIKLCSSLKSSDKKAAFNTTDRTGLYPIHWAAVHNRSDMLEYMLKYSSASKRCQNKLFADGTPLHLAAMNGSLEVVALLVESKSKAANRNEKKQSKEEESPSSSKAKEAEEENNLLELRDAEGQTPLMRSAAPKSRRFDMIRDLLRKNFWSLSGRPAEVAFFLICRGADWRQTEPSNGMNLLHLAILNGYDDIVNMLLTIDKDIFGTRVVFEQQPALASDENTTNKEQAGASSSKKLLLASPPDSLDPLNLAIVYGRVSIISLLWHAKTNGKQQTLDAKHSTAIRVQRKALSKQTQDIRDLRRILWRACWTNQLELTVFLKHTILKGLLILDLIILTFLWAPSYSASGRLSVISTCKWGAFFLGYSLTLALAFRVMLKNPGYLRRNSVQYFNEMMKMLRKKDGEDSNKKKKQKEEKSLEEKSEMQLIKLDSPQTPPIEQQNTRKETAIKTGNDQPPAAAQSDAMKQPEREGPLATLKVPEWQPNSELNDRVRLLCHKCRCVRRPRTKHCNSCNHCVQDFDHHCIYLGCCIGRNNRVDFLLTMIALAITGIYGTLVHLFSAPANLRSTFCHLFGLIWIFKYALVGAVGSFLTLRRACLGVTKFEEIRSTRIRTIFGSQGTPEEISKSHRAYSILKGSFWRYSPDRYLTGELSAQQIWSNWREFSNNITFDEYFLSLICSDTAIARALTSSDTRLNTYQFA